MGVGVLIDDGCGILDFGMGLGVLAVLGVVEFGRV